SAVHKGQVLATIDPQTFDAQVRQARADLGASTASVDQQQAVLLQAQAQALLDKSTYERTKTLADKGIAAQSALDAAAAAIHRSEAGVALARAQLGAQRARVTQSAAALQTSQVNLDRTRILSPIDGVVVNRAIDPGQTVQASFQAPVLFQIAQDLSKLQVKIMVDEADIGQIVEGQTVHFTVDAFPDRTFTGVVTQVRKQPETQANVVAYAVMAEADNPGGILLPGMTANADIVIQELHGVMKVPAAALRFTPGDQQPAQQLGGFPGGGGFGGAPRPQGAQSGQTGQGGRGLGGSQRILGQLDLNADQKAKADAIFADIRSKMTPDMDREARRKVMADAFAKLDQILRPEQRQKLQVLRAQAGAAGGGRAGAPNGVVWVLRNNKPVAVPVRTGASDGSFTEVRGDLKSGDEVIIGGGPRPKVKAAATPFGGPGVRVRM
ncbi:MAG: efflux RND transporter periplasmic adaptor subunit, partial [Caulobacteraceae bacterium]